MFFKSSKKRLENLEQTMKAFGQHLENLGHWSNGFEQRITRLEDRVDTLMGYSNPYAQSEPIEPSPGKPADFLNADFSPYKELFDAAGVAFDPDEIRAAMQRDTAPIPAAINREGYGGEDDLRYWITGFLEYKRLVSLAATYGVTGGGFFDFGGSTGRFFRNFHYQSDNWQVSSCDFKITSVEWNLQNFPSEIRAFQGMYLPILPVEDQSFDLIAAMSVFTHIDETETNWMMELRRVMKPGGILLVTVHNEDHWTIMPEKLRTVLERFDPEFLENETLPSGRFVSTFRKDDPYRCNTFHSNDYIHKQWSRFFDVLDIIPCATGVQSGVVLQKRAQ